LLDANTGSVDVVRGPNGRIDRYDFANPVFRWWRTESGATPTNYDIRGYGLGTINLNR